MFYPDFKEFTKLARKYNIIPVYKEILADCETPVSAFCKLFSGCKYSYLLESVEGGERWGRYSFLSWSPGIIFKAKDKRFSIIKYSARNDKEKYIVKNRATPDPLVELRKLTVKFKPAHIGTLPRFWGGAVGYIGHEYIHCIEDIPRVKKNTLELDDMIFLFTDMIIIFDHFTHTTKIVTCVHLDGKRSTPYLKKKYVNACRKVEDVILRLRNNKTARAPKVLDAKVDKTQKLDIKSNILKERYTENVRKAKEYIRAGDIIQVVLSQRFQKKTTALPFDIYRALRTVNPSPYMFYFNFGNFQVIGSSPEILVRKEDEHVETRPIAGTRPRGKTEEEQKKFEKELTSSVKEKAEHIMLVDLGRNDIGRVCKYSTVKVTDLMELERYSHVIHLVTSVIGKLKQGNDAFDVLRACFPAGTLSGAPKVRALEIISELEPDTRGTYGGAVGYFSYSGNMDMAITIRTVVVKNKTAYVQAGAGIVADSSPEREYNESRNKASALFAAIELAEQS